MKSNSRRAGCGCHGFRRSLTYAGSSGKDHGSDQSQRTVPEDALGIRYTVPMTQLAQRILDEALGLSPDERAQIIGELMTSLDGPAEDGVEEAWHREIRHRLAAIDSGETTPIPWEQAEDLAIDP